MLAHRWGEAEAGGGSVNGESRATASQANGRTDRQAGRQADRTTGRPNPATAASLAQLHGQSSSIASHPLRYPRCNRHEMHPSRGTSAILCNSLEWASTSFGNQRVFLLPKTSSMAPLAPHGRPKRALGLGLKSIPNATLSADWWPPLTWPDSLHFATFRYWPAGRSPTSPSKPSNGRRHHCPPVAATRCPLQTLAAVRLQRSRPSPSPLWNLHAAAYPSRPTRHGCLCSEAVALASGERQARKGVVMAPSSPRRPQAPPMRGP